MFEKILAFSLFIGTAVSAQNPGAGTARDKLDFRFSPPEWQTAICLPDDPHKTLVLKKVSHLLGVNTQI